MPTIPRSTIEQWAVLRAVVEHGGFAQAAACLNRSQSSVSYAVARLQDAAGVALLEIQGRKAELTPAGAALLADAIPLIDDLSRLEERAKALAGGGIASIRLLIDALFPKPRLFQTLESFSARYPLVDVHFREAVRWTAQDARNQDYDLAVLVTEADARDVVPVADMTMIAVAHPEHPLIRSQQAPTRRAMAHHVLVEITGVERPDPAREGAGKVWRMNAVEAALETVRRGLGYGWLPRHLIEADLREGTLKPLPLAVGATRRIPLGLRYGSRVDRAAPAIQWFARLLAESVRDGELPEPHNSR